MPLTVIYLGDGVVGEAVVYGLPFTVGEPVTLPEGFAWADKIANNPTFQVVAPPTVTPPPAADAAPAGAPAANKPRRERKPRAR